MNLYAWIWLAVVVLSVVFEASTSTLIAIWFAPSAILCIILAVLGVPLPVQITVFVVLSGLLMILFYRKLKTHIASKSEKTNLDAIIGKTGIVEEDIKPDFPGRVKVNSISWSAYVKDDGEEIKKGEKVKILSINGVKLLCEKEKQQSQQ